MSSKLPTQVYCKECGKLTEHRPKMDAVKNGNLVCNVCDTENPFRNPSETPDQWVVVKITDRGGPGMMDPTFKVFGAWFGGYLDGDRWQLNSGIERVEEDNDNYYYYGYSGSCYKCRKGAYGTGTSYTSGVLDNMIKRASEGGVTVEIMDKDTDWMEFIEQHKI